MPTATEQKIEKLRHELERHNYLYYQGKPEISDREFDSMMRELIELEKAHPELLAPIRRRSAWGGSRSRPSRPSSIPCR